MERDSILQSSGNELEIIEFYIDETDKDSGETYRSYFGMNVAKVLEIIRRPQVTAMPGHHNEAVLGTFNLRNRVLPLVDLSVWLDKTTPDTEADKVIVSEFSGVVTAFLVSGVAHIHRLTWDRVEPPGKYLQAFSHDSITGVVRLEDRILFILDMEQIIGSMSHHLQMDFDPAALGEENPHFGAGCRILVTDDSQAVRKIIANMLSKSGFSIETASTGKEALELLLTYKQKALDENNKLSDYLDLVISDIEMPEMDGHTLLRNIKSDPLLAVVPVVLLSSHITEALRQKGLSLGADDQISKPDLPSLAHRIRDLIKERTGK